MKLRSFGTLAALILSVITAAALVCSAIAFAAKPMVVKPGTGLAFGEFDLSESDVGISEVSILRAKPFKFYMSGLGQKPWERGTIAYDNGGFVSPNLTPGTYAVTGFRSGDKYYALKDAYPANSFEVEAGKLAYAGSYKLRVKKGGFLRRDKGDFERVDSPAARARLIGWLITQLAGTNWAPLVNSYRSEATGLPSS